MSSPTRTIPVVQDGIRGVILGGLVGYIAFVIWRDGMPFDRERIMLWIVAILFAATLVQRHRPATQVVVDWLPFAAALVAYDYSRGAAETLGMPVQVGLPINADKILFFGKVPTVELQHAWGPFDGTRWWETVGSVVYASHFVVPYAIAGWLWWHNRDRWKGYVARFMTLTMMGLATYVLLPTRPPWLAARTGHLEEINRAAAAGWDNVGLDIAHRLIDKGQAVANLEAALPSLHAAYPMLFLLMFWSGARWQTRALLFVYPVLMGLTLVVSGEHYVFDVLIGWLYAALAVWALNTLDRRRASQ